MALGPGLRHMQQRKKKARAIEPLSKIALDVLMYPVAFLAPFALLPQVIKLYVSQDAGGLSLLTWFLLSVVNALWILYGYVHREPPIIVGNVMFAALHAALIAGILLYG